MPKPILISGMQPSGRLHIGNYLGALKNFVELQNSGKYECYFFIADLHSLIEDFNNKERRALIASLQADYLAVGLDLKKATLFIQSEIEAHTSLAWILGHLAPEGEMRRMTQYKEKSEKKEQVVMEILNYPLLMTADIILYDAEFVPIGDDQLQHLELARALVRKFNKKYGKIFVEPKPILTKTPRIMSLSNPSKKMSKSMPEGCLFLDDTYEAIRKKITRAITDSGSEIKFDEKKKPGIANLMLIYREVTGETLASIETKFLGKNYSQFKDTLSKALNEKLKPFRLKKTELLKNQIAVEKIFRAGRINASKRAKKKIEVIKRTIGLV